MKLVTLIIVSIIALSSSAHATRETGGCGNPASDYCAFLGGQLISVLDKDQADMGLCRLPDDSVIEQFTLKNQTGKAMQAFSTEKVDISKIPFNFAGMEAWEDTSCRARGGNITFWPEPYRPTLKWAVCIFADHSAIEARTLAYGPDYYQLLVKALASPVPSVTCQR
jgi:putative hemolysin